MQALERMRERYETGGRRLAQAVARAVRGLRLSPNAISLSGTLLNGVAAWLVYERQYLAAAAVFLLGSLLDVMDGAVAKVSGRVTPFGGYLDSTLDRVSEGLVIGALGLVFAQQDETLPLAGCFVALAGSYLVSYTRAKAESIGVECKVGLASRAERVVVITAGLVLGSIIPAALAVTVYLLAATASLTVLQRMAHVYRALAAQER